jgi:nitrogen regulatory protein PII
MKKVEAVIVPSYVDAVLAGLERSGVRGGLTLTEVQCRNDGFRSLLAEQGLAEALESGVKLELVVGDRQARKAVDVILQCARLVRDECGGHVVVLDINQTLRIAPPAFDPIHAARV